MLKFYISSVLVVFMSITVAFFVKAEEEEIIFLHHFRDMEPDIAMGDPNPVQATAKIVDGGWNFRGISPGDGLEVGEWHQTRL